MAHSSPTMSGRRHKSQPELVSWCGHFQSRAGLRHCGQGKKAPSGKRFRPELRATTSISHDHDNRGDKQCRDHRKHAIKPFRMRSRRAGIEWKHGSNPQSAGSMFRARVELHVGGLRSLASQPSASEVMGSLTATIVSTRPHFWHSKLR